MSKTLEKKLGKVLIPLITIFKDDLTVNYEKTCELAKLLVKKSYCDALIVAGTNGEFYALSYEERVCLFKEVKEAIGGEIPLVAGTGATTTKETISLTREVEHLGYDAAMVLAPYFGRPTQKDLYEHFMHVAMATSLPIMLYNIPIFTGVNIEPEITVKLAQIYNILGAKEEAGINPLQPSDIILRLPKDADFTIYSGDDTMVLQILIQGGSGVVSGGSHVVGDLMKEQISLFLSGEISDATALYLKTYKFFKALTPGERANPIPLTKAAITLTGFDAGIPRLPLLPPTEEEKRVLKDILKNLGKL